MNVLVLNGSPKAKSDTMRLTTHFLEGMKNAAQCDIEIVDVIKKQVKPCTGCFGCWRMGEGKCVQNDDQNGILASILESDVIIWSFPLYCYSVPSHLKAVIDRLIPLVRLSMREENGRVQHDSLYDLSKKRFVVISGAGFPDWEGNFEGLRLQMKNNFGNPVMVFVPETPLLNIPEAKPLADPLLEKFRLAGEEYVKNGTLSIDTVRALETPMMSRESYLAGVNSAM